MEGHEGQEGRERVEGERRGRYRTEFLRNQACLLLAKVGNKCSSTEGAKLTLANQIAAPLINQSDCSIACIKNASL